MRLDEIYNTSRKYNYNDSYKNYDQSEIDEVIQKVLKSKEFLELSKDYPLVSSKIQLKHGTLAFKVLEKNIKPFSYDIDVTGNIRMNKGEMNRTRLKVPDHSEDMYDRYIININELIDKLIKRKERFQKSFDINLDQLALFPIRKSIITNLDKFDLSKVINSIKLNSCALTSLEGLPKKLNGNLDLSLNTRLTSLKYCPERIGGTFDISNCTSIQSFKYVPNNIGGDFIAINTDISSLEFFPKNINGSINISRCDNLTSLDNIQDNIKGSFYCYWSPITSLKNSPAIVKNTFDCRDTKITSLEYAPLKCNIFKCFANDIKLLQGIGKKYLKECKEIYLPDSIESNILGLCLVNKLTNIYVNEVTSEFGRAIQIVKKHLQTDGDECMEELIQNGYKDYAKF